MSTLLLRLAAPLQSWGVDAKYENRRSTERYPTKSGVIGLLAAALGRRRDESIEDIRSLNFGVRIDREGVLLRDYHTARSMNSSYVTNRYYLMDAVFIAGLEGDDIFLEEIEFALRHPFFPLFLGRRSCPPEGKLSLGVCTGKSLFEALKEEPWQVTDWMSHKAPDHAQLRIIMDANTNIVHPFYQHDLPLSFNQTHRKFGFRSVYEMGPIMIVNPNSFNTKSGKLTEHDPFPELEEV